jgi:multiple sugar transport system substrate-binding protein
MGRPAELDGSLGLAHTSQALNGGHMKKAVVCSIVVFLVAAASAFAAGGGETAAAAKGPVTITWSSWALAEDALRPTYMSMVEAFMKENPDIKVNTTTWPWAQYKDQLIIAASAKNAPDVSHIKEEWTAALSELNSLLPLNNVMSEANRKDFFPEILKGVTFNGQILCVPWFNNPYALFYNKTLLAKAGVKDLPKNLDELMVAARKISALGKDEKGNRIYGYAQPNAKTDPGEGYNFFPVMWAFGGEFVNDKGQVVINTPQNIEAFKLARDIYVNQISPNGSNFKDLRNLFAQGVIGFFYDIEMASAPINKASPKGNDFANEYSAMVIPEKNGPNGHGYVTQHHNVVFSTSKQAAAAEKFAEFLSGEKVLQILYDAGMGKMPARASLLKMGIFSNPAKPLSKAFVGALPTARPLPTENKAFMLADEALADALTQCAANKDSIETIVKNLDARVKQLYGQK